MPVQIHHLALRRLFPYGKSGLKSQGAGISPAPNASLPVWEEWIEIALRQAPREDAAGLFPYGKSGLKSPSIVTIVPPFRSLPVWEEWIEITGLDGRGPPVIVSSRMGRVD